MSHSLISLTGFIEGRIIELITGDTRSLDYMAQTNLRTVTTYIEYGGNEGDAFAKYGD